MKHSKRKTKIRYWSRFCKGLRRTAILLFIGSILWTTLAGLEVSASYNHEKAKQSWTNKIGVGLSWYGKLKDIIGV